jgi:pimeloyl-ACP methyl ester carboxylesterase
MSENDTMSAEPIATRRAAVARSDDVRSVELRGGLRMPYVERGTGPLVLFVHGSLCDYRYWQPQVAGLSSRYRCVAVSLTHYWPLAGLPRTFPFSWSKHADELAEFVEKLGGGPAHVVAHSRGGAVAFQFTVRHPQHVQSLTLADPGGPLCPSGPAQTVLPDTVNPLRAKAAQLVEQGELEAGLQLFVDSVSRVGSWAKSTPGFRTMALDNALTLPLQFQDPLPAYTREAAWSLRCRTMLIDGEKSPELFRRNVALLEGWLPDVRRHTIRGASHGMNLAHPSAFNRHVDEFIRDGE